MVADGEADLSGGDLGEDRFAKHGRPAIVIIREGLWDHPIFVLALLLPAIVVPHLLDLGYWRSDLETLAIGGGAALVGLALAIVEWKAPRIANFIILIAVYWLVDVYFDWSGLAAAGFALIVLICLASPYRDDVRRMIVVFSCFWLIAGLATPMKSSLEPPLAKVAPHSRNQELPPIVHIVLDEQMSPASLPDSIPPGSPAHSMIDDYRDRGFTVFARAVSNSPWTMLSLSQLVSFKLDSPWARIPWRQLIDLMGNPDPAQDLFLTIGPDSGQVLHNRYFEGLHGLGYSISIIQSRHLDFCMPNRIASDECHTYLTYEHGHAMSGYPVSTADRLALALDTLSTDYDHSDRIRSVTLYRLAAKLAGKSFNSAPPARTVAMLAILDQLKHRLGNPEPGRAYFVHLLLPHAPFVFDENCTIKDRREWPNPLLKKWDTENTYRAYWDQVSCTHARVMDIIDRAQETRPGREAIFIIHGDHGSRIWFHRTKSQRTENQPEMLETFLAVKMPGMEAREVTDPVNLQETFARLIDDLVGRLQRQ